MLKNQFPKEFQLFYFFRYFQATKMGHPDERHIYWVNPVNPEEYHCLTCDKVNEFGKPCQWNSGDFSSSGSHYVLTCSGPYTESLVAVIDSSTGENLHTWLTNADLHNQLESKALPLQRDLWVDIEDGLQAQVRILLPNDFDETKKYPLLVYT